MCLQTAGRSRENHPIGRWREPDRSIPVHERRPGANSECPSALSITMQGASQLRVNGTAALKTTIWRRALTDLWGLESHAPARHAKKPCFIEWEGNYSKWRELFDAPIPPPPRRRRQKDRLGSLCLGRYNTCRSSVITTCDRRTPARPSKIHS